MFIRKQDGSVVPVRTSDLTNQLQKVQQANKPFRQFQQELNKMKKKGSNQIQRTR